MTDTTQQQQRLWRQPSYRALTEKRKRLVNGVLLEGLSFTAACKELSLNSTRESTNAALQACLADFRMCRTPREPAEEPSRPSRNVNLYDHARRLGELLGDERSVPEQGCGDIVIRLDADDFLRTEFGILELPVHPAPLTAEQAAKYRAHVAAKALEKKGLLQIDLSKVPPTPRRVVTEDELYNMPEEELGEIIRTEQRRPGTLRRV